MVFKIRTAVKGQALIDFVVEFTHVSEMEKEMKPAEPPTRTYFLMVPPEK